MPLPCYTDEILDSMLSLRRFTSLVQWQCVEAADGSTFRPLRRGDPAEDEYQPIILYKSAKQVYADDGWLWTGASDGTITIGWIVREYAFAGPRWSYEPDTEAPPWMRIDGLVSGVDLELTWFDDRRGIVIGKNGPFQGPATGVPVPGTEENGCFGKSVAFVIQPVGMTPERVFAELPNEMIGQILVDVYKNTPNVVDLPRAWTGERCNAALDVDYRFIANTRPAIDDPTPYKFEWRWYWWYDEWFLLQSQTVDASDYVDYEPPAEGLYRVEVAILDKNQGEKRVSGDIIHIEIADGAYNCVNFNNYAIESYAGAEDQSGEVTIEEDGWALRLVGNLWKKIDFPYVVTEWTVLEFRFTSGQEGEIHAIGFDDDADESPEYIFQLYGTEIEMEMIQDFNDYPGGGAEQAYTIPVGQYPQLRGTKLHITFIMDHDVAEPDGESLFTNVGVYELEH